MLATAAINVPSAACGRADDAVGGGVAGLGQVEHLGVGHVATERQRGLRLDPVDRHQRVGASAVSLGARRTEWVDREVSEQPEPGIGAGHQPVVHDEGTTDAGADRQHGEVLDGTTVAEPVLGLHQGGEVVGERNRAPQPRGELGAEVDVAPSEERRPADIAEVAHDAAEAHADGSDGSPVRQCVDECGKGLDDVTGVMGHQRDVPRRADVGAEIRQHTVSGVGRQLHPDEVLPPGVDVERLRWSTAGAGGHVGQLDDQSGLDQRPGDPAEAGGREVEPLGELRARERAVEQDLQHDAPGGRCERTPRLDPRRHGRRA